MALTKIPEEMIDASAGSADEVLTTDGADATWAAAASGGLTGADTWRVNTGFSSPAEPIASNWEQDDTDAAGRIGSGMAQSSGVFTFPDTGYWLVSFRYISYGTARISYNSAVIGVTINDGGAWGEAAVAYQGHDYSASGNIYASADVQKLVDVSDTANIKVRFSVGGTEAVGADTNANVTFAIFLRLGDT